MVPYVRKSFYKHLKDGVKYIEHDETKVINVNGKPIDISIIDWMKDFSLDRERFWCSDEVYQYALEQTEKEVHQAVEGLYHNLKY